MYGGDDGARTRDLCRDSERRILKWRNLERPRLSLLSNLALLAKSSIDEFCDTYTAQSFFAVRFHGCCRSLIERKLTNSGAKRFVRRQSIGERMTVNRPQRQKTGREETIGGFLIRRLHELGLAHAFGVAGDFNLELLEQIESAASPKWVGCCNELNAAYAADGYARTCGLSALITTYGVGELSALCGVAGAYSEHIPIVAITGAPPLSEIERKGLLHHTAGDGNFENMMECGRQFSVAQARITPQNAVSEIDRCLRACVLQKQPVYLQFPPCRRRQGLVPQ